MLKDLGALLVAVPDAGSGRAAYRRAVVEENRLGKRSQKTRWLSYRHLVSLYGLDPGVAVFRALRFFWQRDPEGRPLLSLLCAYARDPILRASAPFVFGLREGEPCDRAKLEGFLDRLDPGRFSKATLRSTAQNVAATWTQAGHLKGRARKVRARARPTAGAAAYALLLGYLGGGRGQALFHTDYARCLDVPAEQAAELAEEASRRGWIVMKRIGDVVEVAFPKILTAQETERVREQS